MNLANGCVRRNVKYEQMNNVLCEKEEESNSIKLSIKKISNGSVSYITHECQEWK